MIQCLFLKNGEGEDFFMKFVIQVVENASVRVVEEEPTARFPRAEVIYREA